jgi:hypothetical protein
MNFLIFLSGKGIFKKLNQLLSVFNSKFEYNYSIERSVHKEAFELFFKDLRPLSTSYQLIRVGSYNDGGYLIPNDLEGIKYCISPGVGKTINFEADLLERFNIQSFLADPTVERPDNLKAGIDFESMGISYVQDFQEIKAMESQELKLSNMCTLKDFMSFKIPDTEADLILQMDIENAEYLALLSSSIKTLSRFRIMIIEFHSIPKIFNEIYFEQVVSPLFKKLNRIFYPAHVHANNVAKPLKFFKYKIPHSLEITFHNRSRVSSRNEPVFKPIRDELDSPCDPTKPEVFLDLNLFS